MNHFVLIYNDLEVILEWVTGHYGNGPEQYPLSTMLKPSSFQCHYFCAMGSI